MRTRSAQLNPAGSSKHRKIVLTLLQLAAIGVVFVAMAGSALSQQLATPQASQTISMPHVKCVIGLENIKPNVKGTLSLLPNGLEFATGKNKVDISTPAGTVAKAGIPYGGGRIVSLFSHSVEVLTVEYVDSNGGFHGTVFVLSSGKATALKDQLVAQGAKVTPHLEPPGQKEQKP